MFSKNIDFDIDTKEEKLTNTSFLTPPQSLYETLRWTSLLSAKLRCEISASSGIYTGDDVVKALLAGAQTTQVVSTLYENGLERITEMNNYLKNWMEEKEYSSIEDFRGKMAVKKGDSSSFVRTQFMKYFAEIQ
jgi:dihydroorotate dehydrogenase (fumarate)